MDSSYFCYKSTGTLIYDPGKGTKLFEPWWALLVIDKDIINYYAWSLLKYGIPIIKGSAYGPHISFIRGEEPPNKELWGQGETEIEFYYTYAIRTDNGIHAWVDCWSEQLIKIRAALGLPPKPYKYVERKLVPRGYHLTLGRLK